MHSSYWPPGFTSVISFYASSHPEVDPIIIPVSQIWEQRREGCACGVDCLMAQCVFSSMSLEVFHFQALKQKLMFCALKTQLLQLPCVTDLLSKHDLTWPHSKAPSSSELSPYRPFLHLLPLLIFVSSLLYLCQKYFLVLFSFCFPQ